MKDIFISHSSIDKDLFVRPLADFLKCHGVEVWLDETEIRYGNQVLNKIVSGVSESLLFATVISENYMASNWANLELGLYLVNGKGKTMLPIFYGIEPKMIADKYPFLLNNKYLIFNGNVEDVAHQILQIVESERESIGFSKLQKIKLNTLIKEIREYNNIKLEGIALKISRIRKEISNNLSEAFNLAALVAEYIAKDIAETENIYISINNSPISITIHSGILPENICEHMRFLEGLKNSARNIGEDYEVSYLMQMSLYTLVNYYIITYYKKPVFRQTDISIVWPSNVIADDFDEIYNIEKFYLPPELIASAEENKKWFEYNPYTIIGARDTDSSKLIGFIHSLPISDSLYSQIMSGEFDDTNLPISSIRQYDLSGLYKLYISSFCIHPKYQGNISIFKTIFNAFLDMLLELANEHNIFISDIVADGATIKGSSLCENIGMENHTTSIHGTNVYHATLMPPSLASMKMEKHASRLLSYYQQKYETYRDIF